MHAPVQSAPNETLLLAIGRLDATASSAPGGLARLLELRAAVIPYSAGPDGMIALLRGDREGEVDLFEHFDNLHSGIGAVSTKAVSEGLGAAFDALASGEGAAAAAAACTTRLWRGGALAGPWLTLPMSDALIAAAARAADAPRVAPEIAPDVARDVSPGVLPEVSPSLTAVGAWLADAGAALEREAIGAFGGLARARERLAADEAKVAAIGRASYSALDLFHLLADRLILTIGEAAELLGQTIPTAGAAMERLEQLGVAREVTGRARSRSFAYRALVNGVAP